MLGELTHYVCVGESDSYNIYKKKKVKWIKDLSIKEKYTNLTEEYVEKYLCGSGVWNKFLNQDPNNINHKWKIDGMTTSKVKI